MKQNQPPKLKNQIIYTVELAFAIATVYIIIYAFHHREQSELVYIIFNIYALLTVVFSFGFMFYRQRKTRLKREAGMQRLKTFTENISSPALLWNDNFTELVINKPLFELTGIRIREDFDVQNIVPLFFNKKELLPADMEKLTGKQNNREYAVTAADGTEHSVVWNTSVVQHEQGVTWYLAVGTDLSGVRRMKNELESYSKKLAASEGRYTMMMELTDIGFILMEQGNQTIFLSEKLGILLGVPGGSISVRDLRARVYPLDLSAFDSYVQNMRNQMRSYMDKTYKLELRISTADKQYRWFSYRFKAIERADSNRLMVGGSVIDISEEKAKDMMIEKTAYEDNVTGISNRNKLMRMGDELYQCTIEIGSRTNYWVIIIDIDRFHLINDTCGYAAGNVLLKGMAEILITEVNAGGFGARISGDNFALILHDSGDEHLPEKVVGRIQRKLNTKAVGDLANHTLTCSAGYAKMPADGENFEKIMERAEFALSSNKHKIGGIFRYTPTMHDSIIRESTIEAQLTEAIMKGELLLYYQPKVSIENGEIIGLEALVRWQTRSGELLPPGVFIPVAEKSHLITQVTRFVLYETCRQLKLWQQIGLPELVVSINVSSTDFYQENFIEVIRKALTKFQLEPRFLEIELTESLALKDIDLTISTMQKLLDAGVGIAMDDFGTGYSSLSNVQRLPFTMIKLDRSFIVEMEHDTVMREVVCSVVRIAKAKNIHTIAEGVETPEQENILRECGCDYIQGYLYSKPLSAKETERYIRERNKRKQSHGL